MVHSAALLQFAKPRTRIISYRNICIVPPAQKNRRSCTQEGTWNIVTQKIVWRRWPQNMHTSQGNKLNHEIFEILSHRRFGPFGQFWQFWPALCEPARSNSLAVPPLCAYFSRRTFLLCFGSTYFGRACKGVHSSRTPLLHCEVQTPQAALLRQMMEGWIGELLYTFTPSCSADEWNGLSLCAPTQV